jgi:hypothetical protein
VYRKRGEIQEKIPQEQQFSLILERKNSLKSYCMKNMFHLAINPSFSIIIPWLKRKLPPIAG